MFFKMYWLIYIYIYIYIYILPNKFYKLSYKVKANIPDIEKINLITMSLKKKNYTIILYTLSSLICFIYIRHIIDITYIIA